jgi:ketosteroid isomerase-like protein
MLALKDIGRRHDWDGLRAAHLEGSKFSEIGAGLERNDFEEMIAGEIARMSAVQDLSIDWRELKIDVFGDVAVATSFPLYTWTDENGETGELERRATMVYVKTTDGWKIAHEHLSPPGTE